MTFEGIKISVLKAKKKSVQILRIHMGILKFTSRAEKVDEKTQKGQEKPVKLSCYLLKRQ